jgi:DNA-binding NarL/FixJ family response regulator
METRKIRLLIVDDNAVFRRKLAEFLQECGEMEVIGEAGTGRDGLSKARELKPDLVLMDVRLPDMNGLSIISALKVLPAAPKVIVLTVFDCIEYRQSAEIAGAVGYVVKASITDELLPAIRTQVDGSGKLALKRKCKDETDGGASGMRLGRME